MTFEREWFTIYESIVARKVYMGDDTILEAIDEGSIKATMQVGGKMLLTTITQVLHVPKMKNCRNPTLAKCGGEAQQLEKSEELESSGTPECSELDSKAQNTSHWGVLGVIGKVFKRRY